MIHETPMKCWVPEMALCDLKHLGCSCPSHPVGWGCLCLKWLLLDLSIYSAGVFRVCLVHLRMPSPFPISSYPLSQRWWSLYLVPSLRTLVHVCAVLLSADLVAYIVCTNQAFGPQKVEEQNLGFPSRGACVRVRWGSEHPFISLPV